MHKLCHIYENVLLRFNNAGTIKFTSITRCDSWTKDKSIRRVIIVKRDIAAALSSSTVHRCPSAVCVGNTNTCTLTHIYTSRHTKNAQNGFCITQATFLAIQFIYRCCHDNQSFILQIPGSCPWWGIVITTPQRDSKNHRSLSYQTQGINTHKKNSQHIKIQHILAIWPFSLHPPTLLHAKHTHTAGILLM